MDLKDSKNYDELHRRGQSTLFDFWASVKSGMGRQRIEKCFLTGVLPLSLADVTSGFNIVTNVSAKQELAGLCGLSKDDVRSALELIRSKQDVTNQINVTNYISTMEHHYNGYSFSPRAATRSVFNTNTCLEYLQVSSCDHDFFYLNIMLLYSHYLPFMLAATACSWFYQGLLMDDPINLSCPSNWETSETLLQVLADSPVAIGILLKLGDHNSTSADAWRNPITSDSPTWYVVRLVL